MDVTRTDRRVVTFYSFKGGVGRTMALANVAFRMADRHDLDVIAVDWDLEAPGLHRFFGISDEVAATRKGLLDYLLAWREAVEDDADAPPDATGSLIEVTDPKPAHGSLKLLLAGRLDEGYSDRLRGFDWLPFYRVNAGYAAIETLRRQLADQSDMVFVDSRTGLTDAGGICTVQMPDGVVLMTAANEQSWKGIERVGRAIAEGERDRPGRGKPKAWVVVGRAPYLDVPKHGEDWFEEYGQRFEAARREGLWARVDHPRGLRSYRLPHVGRWGFGEQILSTGLDDDDPLAAAYGLLGDALVRWALGKEGAWAKRPIEELRRDVEVAEKRHDLARLSSALRELGYALAEAGELVGAAEMFQKDAGIHLALNFNPGYSLTLVLLGRVRLKQERFADAEELFERATQADPKSAFALSEYATFLWSVRSDADRSEELLKRATEADPEDAGHLGAYASFLTDVRKDHEQAESFFKRALEADATHDHILGMYAAFLAYVRKDLDRAEELFKRALEIDPRCGLNLPMYVFFLVHVRRDPDKAQELLERALVADAKHATLLGTYATFLNDVRRDDRAAEGLFERAIDADPKHTNNLGYYALFRWKVRKDFDKAEELFERAIEAAPRYAIHLGDYASFLQYVRKDSDRAGELYERAIEAYPKHAVNLGDYANFLWGTRKDADRALELYRRAIEADPKHANNLGNYAGLLLGMGRQTEGLAMLDRALDAPSPAPDLRVECWFYAFAHRPPERRGEALAQLKRLTVAEGARSPGWDLSHNVERAHSEGHPDAAWLALLADVITKNADAAQLDAWPAWAAA
jgi:Tfp pilus assembly protein PilF/cellulose biosynthesis protein BcsQ